MVNKYRNPCYGFKDMERYTDIPPDEEQLARRRIASALKRIIDQSIRMDASEEQLTDYADQLEAVEAQMYQHKRIEQDSLFRALAENRATKADLYNACDYYFLTGPSSPVQLPMELWSDGDRIRGEANVGAPYQGPPGRVHGGMIAAIFDVLLSRSLQLTKVRGYTATLNIKYRRGTPLYTDLELEAEIVSERGRRVVSKGVIKVGGEVCAEAEGVWIKPMNRSILKG